MTSHIRTPITEVFAVCIRQSPPPFRAARVGTISFLLKRREDGLWTLPSVHTPSTESRISALAGLLAEDFRGLWLLGHPEHLVSKPFDGPQAEADGYAAYTVRCYGEIVPEPALGDPESTWVFSIDREMTKISRKILSLAINQGWMQPTVVPAV